MTAGERSPEQVAEWLNANDSAGLGQRMGIRIVEASGERVVGTMPVEGNTQPYGLLHGGASCVSCHVMNELSGCKGGWASQGGM